MYEQHWGLSESPFDNTPNPRFLYYSKQHEEGLSRLLYAVERKRGAAILTGVFGCGKTVLAHGLLGRLNRNIYQIGLVTNPYLKSVELLRAIVRQLGIENLPEKLTEMSSDYFLQLIEQVLMNNASDGKDTVIIIDEAHVIKDNEIFEELRLLMNFQLENKALFTLILMGQPELMDKIRQNKQFTQRIAIGYSLSPLNEEETGHYVRHRIKVAGATQEIFSPEALTAIFNNSGGIPRRINQICDMSLIAGFTSGAKAIDDKIVNDAVSSIGV